MAISNTTDIEKRLWEAADELRANSKLKASEYSVPVLGLVSLRYADAKFARVEAELAGNVETSHMTSLQQPTERKFGPLR